MHDNLLIKDERPEIWVATIEAVDESGKFIVCQLTPLAKRMVVDKGASRVDV